MLCIICVLLCALTNSIANGALPQNVMANNCKRSDPNLDACLLRRAPELLRQFSGGMKQLGIESFDPLFLRDVSFQENEGSVNIHAHLDFITLVGHKDAQFQEFTFDPRTLSGNGRVFIPKILMRSLTQIEGTILAFPVNSGAYFNFQFDEVTYAFAYQLSVFQKGGVKYFNLDYLAMGSYSENGALQVESTDPENEEADRMIQNGFNSNPRFVLDALNSFLTKSAAEIYKKYFNSVLHNIPTSELLPR